MKDLEYQAKGDRFLQVWEDEVERKRMTVWGIKCHEDGTLPVRAFVHVLYNKGVIDAAQTQFDEAFVMHDVTDWQKGNTFVLYRYVGAGNPEYVAFDTKTGSEVSRSRHESSDFPQERKVCETIRKYIRRDVDEKKEWYCGKHDRTYDVDCPACKNDRVVDEMVNRQAGPGASCLQREQARDMVMGRFD